MYEVLFKVPEQLVHEFSTGQVHRFGAILKSAETGRIVAHMQETGLGQQLMSNAASTFGLADPFGVLGLTTGGFQIVQNEQIKSAIAAVHQLQLANLFLGGVGIGVSVAGFAVTNMKISRLKAAVDATGVSVERLARDLQNDREDFLDRELADLGTHCRTVDEAWLLQQPEAQWNDAARRLHECQGRLYSMATRVRGRQGAASDLFALLVEAWLIATGARVTARMASGEMEAARAAVSEAIRDAGALTGAVGESDLVDPRVRALPEFDYRARMQAARQRVLAFREREDMLESRSHLVRNLIEAGVRGRDYLEAARNEKTAPLMLFGANATR